jgi:hypothetical protein
MVWRGYVEVDSSDPGSETRRDRGRAGGRCFFRTARLYLLPDLARVSRSYQSLTDDHTCPFVSWIHPNFLESPHLPTLTHGA